MKDILNKDDIISIIDDNLDDQTVKVCDDVFKSKLGNLYLITKNNEILYLSKVINIEEKTDNDNDSKLYKWYELENKNYLRKQKIKKIL